MTDRRADLVELVARAICTRLGGNPDTPLFVRVGFDSVPSGKLVWTEYIEHATAALAALESAGVDLATWMPIESAPMPKGGLHTLPYLCGRAPSDKYPGMVGMARTTKALGSDRTFYEPITMNINPFFPITHFRPLPKPPESNNG